MPDALGTLSGARVRVAFLLPRITDDRDVLGGIGLADRRKRWRVWVLSRGQ